MHKLLWIGAAIATLAGAQTFEVASIRPSAFQSGDGEGSRRESIEPSPDGLIMRNMTLRDCLSWAYKLPGFQISGAAASAVERYDIAAKAGDRVSQNQLRAMLAALLQDRFKLEFHRESKVISAYALVIVKGGPKLHESKEDGPGVLQPRAAALVGQHASMQELADALSVAVRMPVIDETGLNGRYDFTVDLMPYIENGVKGGAPDFESFLMSALPDQLGLTLKSRKEPVEILVIDHAEQTPSEN
jgi:uncharacterized protein (TIGR03435 family)